jgi:hypothetical protein
MSNRQTHTPTIVLLPTVSLTDGCDEVAAQLGPEDELLGIYDSDEDPVADRNLLPEDIQFIPAGDPGGRSGKANATAVGMEAASHDRLDRTDDDFHHLPDWIDGLYENYRRSGTARVPRE